MSTVDHDNEMIVYEQPAPVTLFRTDNPSEVVERATATATALAAVVKKQKLTTRIGQGEHVRVEGWTLLGTMLGVFPVLEWTRKLEDGWEARVEAKTMSGVVVGAAEAQCLRSESTWRTRDDYALRSMAQTRATSKALRQPLGFVMTLAGFDATPAEEMPHASEQTSQFQPPASASGSGPMASEPQRKNIVRLVNKVTKEGIVDPVELSERLTEKYGTSVPAEFTKAQASQMIDGLKKLAGEEE